MAAARLSLSFRAAASRDLEAITALYNTSFGPFVETSLTPLAMTMTLYNSRQQIIVAETREKTGEERLAGFIIVNAAPRTFFDSTRDALNVDVLAVDPACRRLGVGRKLMNIAERIGLKDRFNAVTLQVHEDNAPAIALYEDMGYTRMRTTPRFYKDGGAAHQMRKTLVPANTAQPWKAPAARSGKPRR
jgi:ribosomal protein S18 acetylase RimI-like enzyme